MAPRPKPVNEALLFELAKILCTDSEIADILTTAGKKEHGKNYAISESQIKLRYAPLLKRARNGGRGSLRRKQFALAMAGDKTMLIWLGKQVLGQKDKQDITSDNKSIAMPAPIIFTEVPGLPPEPPTDGDE